MKVAIVFSVISAVFASNSVVTRRTTENQGQVVPRTPDQHVYTQDREKDHSYLVLAPKKVLSRRSRIVDLPNGEQAQIYTSNYVFDNSGVNEKEVKSVVRNLDKEFVNSVLNEEAKDNTNENQIVKK